ncbi:MAG: hypothetical protein M3247_01285, partial [Thermoproteota archaeon]|nr:hypothetical protein [Thermoproteota archaeon]
MINVDRVGFEPTTSQPAFSKVVLLYYLSQRLEQLKEEELLYTSNPSRRVLFFFYILHILCTINQVLRIHPDARIDAYKGNRIINWIRII